MTICLKNPDVHARLEEALRSDVDPTRIVPSHTYLVKSGRLGLPSLGVLIRVHGSWSGVAKAFGLHLRGYTRGKNSSHKPGMTITESPLDEVSRQIDAIRQRIEEAEREQELNSVSLNCKKAYRTVGEWDFVRDKHGEPVRDEDGHAIYQWRACFSTSVWAVR